MRSRRTSRRRKLVWATCKFTGLTMPMGGGQPGFAVDLLEDLHAMPTPNEPAVSTMGATVMRTHGRIQWTFSAGLGNFPLCSYGLSVDQTRNLTIGPSPGGVAPLNPGSANTPGINNGLYRGVDWALFDQYIPVTVISGNILPNAPTGQTATEGTFIDIRSRRKIQEVDETWALSFYVEPSGTDPGFQVSGFVRTLIALP